MSCPGDPLLSEFAQGVLEEPALSELERHLDSCPDCRRRLALAAAAAGEAQDAGTFDRGARLGRYVLIDRLGRGGMGLVLRAYDPELDRRVALKVLDRPGAPEAELAALLAEARAAARLVHPNVVVIHDVGREGARAFVAMELVEGGSLARWLKEERRPPRRVLEIFRAAGEGLAAAHRAGLVHRDFKPDNVLLGTDGRPRVADFGLARLTTLADAATRACGTPGYMPPEQYAGTADARADVFAFSSSLWEALSGSRPFASLDSPEALEAVRQGRPAGALPRGVPSRVRRALLRGLSFRPEDRFGTMPELLAELAPPRSRALAFVAAAGLSLAAVLGVALGVGRVDPCAPGAPLSGWDDAARLAARTAFAASGKGYAEAAFQDFDRLLTAWTTDGATAARAACLDARGRQPADLTAARASCLQRASRDARALVSLAAHADAVFVDHAAQAVRALPSLAVCADPALARAATLPPADPATRRETERLADRLSEARTLLEGGAWSRGRTAAAEVAAAAGATGFRPLVAEALLLRGSAEHLAGAEAQAEVTLRQAASEADVAGHDRVRAQALTLLVRVVGEALRRPAEAEAWVSVATGALARAGSPPEISAELDASRSQIAFGRGDYAQAVTAMQSAVATWERLGDRGTVGLASALAEVAAIEVSRGNLDASEAAARRSLSVGGSAFPPGHPARSDVLSALGGVRLRKGDAREASALLGTLAQELEASVGPAHPDALWARVLWGIAQLGADRPLDAAANLRAALKAAPDGYPRRYTILRQLGTAEVDLGETAAGLAHLLEAHRLQGATPGQNVLDEAAGRAFLARGLLAAGRGREALEHARAAVATLAGKVPAESERMGLAHLVLGRALAASGKGAEAVPELEAAIAAHAKMTTFALRRAEARFALAQLVPDRARALSLAREALADLDGRGQPAPWRADLTAWLSRAHD